MQALFCFINMGKSATLGRIHCDKDNVMDMPQSVKILSNRARYGIRQKITQVSTCESYYLIYSRFCKVILEIVKGLKMSINISMYPACFVLLQPYILISRHRLLIQLN